MDGPVSLHGGLRLPTWRVWVSYVEGLSFLRGVSGGAVGEGGFVVGDGAAATRISPDRTRDGRSRRSATLPGVEAVAVNCAPPKRARRLLKRSTICNL